jgi:PncC family amidohydrolase
MKALLPLAQTIAQRLIARRETIAIAESSTGGLIAAALLAVPGASAYFLGGAVVYTKSARAALLSIGNADMEGFRPASEAYALLLAKRVRDRHSAVWGLGETGATGPTGNRYGDPAGHTCIVVGRTGRAGGHIAHRQRRADFEHGRFRQARARIARRGHPRRVAAQDLLGE